MFSASEKKIFPETDRGSYTELIRILKVGLGGCEAEVRSKYWQQFPLPTEVLLA